MFFPGAAQSDEGLDLEAYKAKRQREMEALAALEQGMAPPRPVAEQPPAPIEPPAPKVVAMPDLYMDAARESDAGAGLRRALETAGRQLVGGLTLREPSQTITQPGTAVGDLQKERQRFQMEALRQLEMGRQAKLDEFNRANVLRDDAYRAKKDVEDAAYRAEKDKTDQELRRLAIQASNNNAAAMRAIAGANLGIRKTEAEVKEEERANKKAAGSIRFAGGILETDPGLSDTERGQARTKASLWNAALDGMSDLEAALAKFVAAPSRQAEADLRARVSTVSTALNAAQGQGAMSEGEAKRIADTLGADIRTTAGLEAVVKSLMGDNPADAGKMLLTKVRAAQDSARKGALGALSSYGTYKTGKAASGPTEGGLVTLVDESGNEYDVSPDQVDAILKAKPKLRRK